MSKALQYNTISKTEYLTQKNIPNSAPIGKPPIEQARQQIHNPVDPPADVAASAFVRPKKEVPLLNSERHSFHDLSQQQQQTGVSQVGWDAKDQQLYAMQNAKGLEKENKDLRAQLTLQTREILNAQGLKADNQALRQRITELKAIADTVREAEKDAQLHRERNAELSTQLNAAKASNIELNKTAIEVERLRDEIAKYKALEIQHNQLLQHSLKLQSELDYKEKELFKLQKLQDEYKRVGEAYDSSKKVTETQQIKITEVEKSNAELLNDNIKMKELLDQLNFDLKSSKAAYAKLQASSQAMYNDIQKMQEQLQWLQVENAQLKQKNDGLQKFVVQCENRDKEIGDLKYQLGIAESRAKTIQQQFDNSNKKQDQLQLQCDQQFQENKNLKLQLDHHLMQNKQLNEQNWKLKDVEMQAKQLQDELIRVNVAMNSKSNEVNQYKIETQRYQQQAQQFNLADQHNRRLQEQIIQMEKEITMLKTNNQQLEMHMKQSEEAKYQAHQLQLQNKAMLQDLQQWKDYANKLEYSQQQQQKMSNLSNLNGDISQTQRNRYT